MKKILLQSMGSLVLLGGLLGNMYLWHQTVLGVLLLFLFSLWLAWKWQPSIARLLKIKEKTIMTYVIAVTVVIYSYALLSGISVMWHHLTMAHITGILSINAVLPVLFWVIMKKKKTKRDRGVRLLVDKYACSAHAVFGRSPLYLIAFIFLWAIGMALLFSSTSDAVLLSPWQTVHHLFSYIFALVTLLVGILLFSRHSTGVLLIVLMLYGVLLHAYVPLSHVLPWGGDVWRHIAIEERIVNEEFIHPVLFGEMNDVISVWSLDIPRVLVHPQKYSYSLLWGLTSIIHTLTGLSLEWIHIWLVPLLFALIVPVLLFRLGHLLFNHPRRGLWFAAGTFAVYPFQAAGSLTIPVSLSFVFFLLTLIVWATYLRYGYRYMRILLLFLGILLCFAYSLYAILFWGLLLCTVVYQKIKRIKNIGLRRVLFWLLMIASMGVIPLIEWLFGTWHMTSFSLNNVVQALGQWSGWYYVTEIRDHDILSGNILINHTPSYAYVASFLTMWRWWILAVLAGIYASVGAGIFFVIKDAMDDRWRVLWWASVSLFGGYIIGWHFGAGDLALVRRLDIVLALLVVLFAVRGWGDLMDILRTRVAKKTYRVILLTCVLCFIALGLQTYLSGPDEHVISKDEYDAGQFISEELSWHEPACVIADTWVLLALERSTHAYVVGGGFPMEHQYGQRERVALFEDIEQGTFTTSSLAHAHTLTSSTECFVVTENDVVLDELFEEQERIGSLHVWKEKRQEVVTE
ncbi:hypothetical protein KKG22_04310 [Patescibacteria group bacterium]|nr:hypothetical protein [Patescibacteria group bacterium]MBU1721421.1 hypothetical protein [Patescibacteria group bacterium]MBU1901861.1 hypothetical protein [Patescibacteria group bacterium]